MNIYQVGSKYGELVGEEGIKIDVTDSGIIMNVKFFNPSSKEIKNISKDKIKLELVKRNGILFFVIKFGNMQWMDAPYTPHLSKNLSHIKEISQNQGFLLNIILADSRNGEIKSMRAIGISNSKSVMLKEFIEDELKKEFDIRLYDLNLRKVYSRYSTQDLLKYKLQ